METPKYPALFVGHGSPMNAIEDNEFCRTWTELGRTLPRPNAILCISAHWQTQGPKVTAMPRPRTIYDFYGFPPELYRASYPAPGSPELAAEVQSLLGTEVSADLQWGLDHGTWSVLIRMYPQAEIPVVQLGLDLSRLEEQHYELARKLHPLRRQGVMIMGSGNAVHNLRLVNWQGSPYDWALEADSRIKELIETGDHAALTVFPRSSRPGRLAVPTNEHYLPLLYVLALQEEGEPVRFFNEQVSLGSISMRGVVVG